MTTDAKETEVPSTPAPLPETPVSETPVTETPVVDKGGETPAAPPAASAKETPPPTKVVDEAGDELTPEEQDVMARLTGQKTEEKTTATPVVAEKVVTPPVETPPAETVEEVAGIKLPSSHELAGYKPETRKRIEQFTTKIKEIEGPATAFTSLVDGYRALGVTPEQFHAWQGLGQDLRAKDPTVRQAAIESLHQIALKTGLKVEAAEPDNTAVLAKINELQQSMDLDPAHAEALRTVLNTRKPAPAKPAAESVAPPQPDPRILVQQAVMNERLERAKYEAQESLAEAAALIPVNDQQAFQAEVMGELAKIETNMRPEDLNNTMKWGSRMRTAAKTVLSRRQAQNPTTVRPTQSLRPTTPNVSQSDEPQPGTEAYEIGVLTGKIQVKQR